jgi:hypothetical protein
MELSGILSFFFQTRITSGLHRRKDVREFAPGVES